MPNNDNQQISMFGEDVSATANTTPTPQSEPLAARMRPHTLDEIAGQDALIGPDKPLRKLILSGRIPSMIFWGPPGCGKTTLAEVIALTGSAHFVRLSAVTSGVADLRRVVEDARRLLQSVRKKTVVFLDEAHRFNKSQQDALLPHVENGTITLIGATTENPSFEVNAALLSRCRVFTLQPLQPEHIQALLLRALTDAERGLGKDHITADEDALQFLVMRSAGDARMALTVLEICAATVLSAENTAEDSRRITLDLVKQTMQTSTLLYDRAGEEHYNLISALHKSIRGSDPDAALYWLARILESGEDPQFAARRLLRMASEDIGLADPQALSIALAAQQAAHMVGMPECSLALAEAAVYLACAPKSNALYVGYAAAKAELEAGNAPPVPLHIRNAPTSLMKRQQYGAGYIYSQDIYAQTGPDPEDATMPPPIETQPEGYLPESLQGKQFYQPGANAMGYEAKIARWLTRRRAKTK